MVWDTEGMSAALSHDQFGENLDQWSFDVHHATNDDLMNGQIEKHHTRTVISRKEVPDHLQAAILAAQMVPEGHLATNVMARI